MEVFRMKSNAKVMKNQITHRITLLISLFIISGLTNGGFAQTEKLTGNWTIQHDNGTIDLRMILDHEADYNYQTNKLVSSDFTGYKVGKAVTFSLERPAGKIDFKGDIDDKGGNGTFTFYPDIYFIKEIADN